MPLFGRRRPPAPTASVDMPGPGPRPPGRDLEDQEALARGDLPVSVRERLERERGRDLPWTSTLSVADWALGRRLSFEPVGQVMGSSIYHTGWSYVPGWQSGELDAPTRAAHRVRTLALERMRQEAQVLGAAGVVAVRITRRAYAWGANLTEFTATGTAVRVPSLPPAARPFLATVDGADLTRLVTSGHVPLGVALGVSVAYVYTDWTSLMQDASWANQEMVTFTQATYAVRELAMGRLEQQARADGADGVIAYDTAMTVEAVERGGGGGQGERTDHILEFSAIGTAIGRVHGERGSLGALAVVSLGDPSEEEV
jgi:uncharacterized protein YbjQ (UPF0145 family)